MIKAIVDLFQAYPQIPVFLSLAAGYYIGRFKVRGFGLGSTASVLLVALVLGQTPLQIPALLKNVSFALFTFCIGYKVGPQFFGALRKEGLNYIWISLVIAFTSLATAVILGKLFGFDRGTTAGLFAGAMTTSAAIGTAEGAVAHLGLTETARAALDTNIAVAYAITYIFGTVGGIVSFIVIPRLMKIDMKEEALKLEATMSGGASDTDRSPELFSWSRQLTLRAYRVETPGAAGKKVAELEALFPYRVAVEKIKREKKIISPTPETVIQSGDILLVGGSKRTCFLEAPGIIGPEVDISDIAEVIGEVMEICVLNEQYVDKSLRELAGDPQSHGLFLRRITRMGHEVPLLLDTAIEKCDLLQVIGAREDVERAVKILGYAERPTEATDLVMVGAGCAGGTLLGLLAVHVDAIPITLGVGGGVLVAGLLFGWLRSIHPTFGQIPGGGRWILQDLGLNLFIACVGLGAGAEALKALETTGLSVFFAGVIVTLLPVIAGLLFARLFLKMNPVLLMGALAGGRNLTAALNTLQEDAGSATPVLGYAAPYAFANVLLTIWGTIIVSIM
jgi:putative transport protein